MLIRPLSKTLELGAGETATSFACRISSLWRTPSADMFWKDVGVPFRNLVRGDEASLCALAFLTAADPDALIQNSPRVLDGITYAVGKEVIWDKELARGRHRICPLCAAVDIAKHPELRADQAVYGRLRWQFPAIDTCEHHNCALIEVATDLPVDLSYHDFGLRIGMVTKKLTVLEKAAVPRPFPAFQQYYCARLEGKETNVPLLDDLHLHHVASACMAFGTASLFGPKRNYKALTSPEWHDCRQEGFRILADGPTAVGALFSKLLANPAARATRSHTAPGTLGPIFGWLNCLSYDRANLEEFKAVVAEQAFATFPSAGGETLFGYVNKKPPVMLTVHDVQRRYGISWITAGRVAKLAGVLKPLREGALVGPKVICFDDAERLFGKFKDVISITELAKDLGATQKQLMALIEAGHLTPAFDTCDVLASFWRSDVAKFTSLMLQNAQPVPDRAPEMVSISRAAWRSAPDFSLLINAILDGHCRWLGCFPSGRRLFSDLLINRKEAATLLGKVRGEHRVDTLCQSELCDRLKVNSVAIAQLVERKILPAQYIGGRGDRYRICTKRVAEFERKYVSLKRLALQRHEHWAVTKALIKHHDVRAAFPTLRGNFYPRSQLRKAQII